MIIGKGERRMCLGLAGVFRALSARGFDAGVPHVGVPDAGDTSSSDTTPATLLRRHYSGDTTPATLLQRHYSSDTAPATFLQRFFSSNFSYERFLLSTSKGMVVAQLSGLRLQLAYVLEI
jgi:hypothetical protein